MNVVVLDSGPLGILSNPNATDVNERARSWLVHIAQSGTLVVIPEIADYEVRRELLRGEKFAGLRRLDLLKQAPGIRYLPLNTEAMLQAAKFWARTHRQGLPTATSAALDVDAILAAQATVFSTEGMNLVVATTNLRHLQRFVKTKEWSQIVAI
jgi:predicted nucleic acid-binding protein